MSIPSHNKHFGAQGLGCVVPLTTVGEANAMDSLRGAEG
jgi:hypothetical protein